MSQQAPRPNGLRPIAELVIEDIEARAAHGEAKYGVKLQAHNGRNAIHDAYEEALDLAHYLKQHLEEHHNERPSDLDIYQAEARRTMGNGVKLQAHNGRNAIQDAYEEALDLAHYLKQHLEEHHNERPSDLDIYQAEARRTMGDGDVIGAVLGLVGETGEVVDLVKKGFYHGHTTNNAKIKEELGDVLWYVAAICTHYGISLHEAATSNIDKLRKRYPDGFSFERSINREKENEDDSS